MPWYSTGDACNWLQPYMLTIHTYLQMDGAGVPQGWHLEFTVGRLVIWYRSVGDRHVG